MPTISRTLRTTLDPRGEPLFRTNGALQIPVGPGVRVAAVGTRAEIFDAPVDLVATHPRGAADAAVQTDPATRSAAMTSSLADARRGRPPGRERPRRAGRPRPTGSTSIRDRLASSGLQLDDQKSGLQDVDVTAVVAQIQSKQLNLQAAQAIFAKVNQNSLFDLIK